MTLISQYLNPNKGGTAKIFIRCIHSHFSFFVIFHSHILSHIIYLWILLSNLSSRSASNLLKVKSHSHMSHLAWLSFSHMAYQSRFLMKEEPRYWKLVAAQNNNHQTHNAAVTVLASSSGKPIFVVPLLTWSPTLQASLHSLEIY